ncbi:MAG TPA: hypothetical protein DCX14_08015 [Flavobacteriales bacterium]|nr:hypothetical protein [Flavobacteriales bacterium]
MNEVNIYIGHLHGAKLLTAKGCAVSLWRIGKITFGICKDADSVHFGFGSGALSDYLDNNPQTKIIDLKLYLREGLVGTNKRDLLLQLKKNDGNLITLDQQDHLYEAIPYIESEPRGHYYAPSRVWGFPLKGYLCRMLLTERLVQLISDIAVNNNERQLIHIMWKEYQLAKQVKGDQPHLTVSGEFTGFSVRKFTDDFLIFDYA